MHLCQLFFWSSKHFWNSYFRSASACSSIRTVSHQLWQNTFLSFVSSVSGSCREPKLVNTVVEALRCCFRPFVWKKLRCHTYHSQNIQNNCITWTDRYANILFYFPTIFCHCFDVFLASWRGWNATTLIVINIFSVFCKVLVPLNATVNILIALEHFIPFLRKIFYRFFSPFLFQT